MEPPHDAYYIDQPRLQGLLSSIAPGHSWSGSTRFPYSHQQFQSHLADEEIL
ncbi:hypothetical protein SAY86_028630 [Trapa natans]|uniref:Uncharacterized protein n=1 Tax=Trapa natans TaxID=22666 RepID=A0AAN7M2H4_TRANT|nr:hypothetical protein SAY86_028630 [Trapa natans]